MWLRRPDAIPPVVTFVASDGVSTSFQPAVSPDGTRIAFVADRPGGESLIYVRALDSATAQPLKGTEAAVRPFWSPDSRWLAFFAGGKLKKVDLLGGAPVTLTDALASGGSWNADDLILFRGPPSSQARPPAQPGHPYVVTSDGQRFLFITETSVSTPLTAIVNWPSLLTQ